MPTVNYTNEWDPSKNYVLSRNDSENLYRIADFIRENHSDTAFRNKALTLDDMRYQLSHYVRAGLKGCFKKNFFVSPTTETISNKETFGDRKLRLIFGCAGSFCVSISGIAYRDGVGGTTRAHNQLLFSSLHETEYVNDVDPLYIYPTIQQPGFDFFRSNAEIESPFFFIYGEKPLGETTQWNFSVKLLDPSKYSSSDPHWFTAIHIYIVSSFDCEQSGNFMVRFES